LGAAFVPSAASVVVHGTLAHQQSVDDSHTALVIPTRSSYVPSITQRRLIAEAFPDVRLRHDAEK
jgi:hypothetical protein